MEESSNNHEVQTRSTENTNNIEEDGEALDATGVELLMSRFSFHPLHVFGEWLDANEGFAKRLSVSIVLPSGVATSKVIAKVVSNGTVLQIETEWSSQLCYPEQLCSPFVDDKNLIGYTSQHPEIVALELSLKELRKEIGKKLDERLFSTAQIRLPFPVVVNKVENVVMPFNTMDVDSSRCMVLNVRLFAVEDDYGIDKATKRPKLLDTSASK